MGSPEKLTPVVKYGGGFIALLFAAGVIGSVFHFSSPAVAAPPAQSTQTAPETPSAPAASPPSHIYAMEDSGEYGYERPVSQDEINAGQTTNPLIMIRYLGQRKDGSYFAMMREGSARTTVSCKEPCNYIKVTVTYDGQSVGPPSLLPAGNNLATAIMLDAMAGYLKPYSETQHATEAD